MDFGSPPKLAPVAGVQAVPRADVTAQPGSVPVELPPEQTVQSARAGEALKLDIRQDNRRSSRFEAQAAQVQAADEKAEQLRTQETLQRRVLIERNTHSVVVQERDPHTGETVSMVPDEATLRLRIFARALAEQKQESPAPGQSVAVTA